MGVQNDDRQSDNPLSARHMSEDVIDFFMRLRGPEGRAFTLLPCSVDGKPSVALVEGAQEIREDWPATVLRMSEDGEDWYFYPWFVLATSAMAISFESDDATG